MDFFLCNVAWASGTTLHKVFPVERCPRNIVQDFSYAMLSGVSWTIFHRFLTCAMLSQSIKTTLNRIFSCQCCLQPLEQLCIGFWYLQCFPRVLRQHWTGFFFCAMLSGASGTTLHRVFPVQRCPRSIKRQHFTASQTTLQGILICVMLS